MAKVNINDPITWHTLVGEEKENNFLKIKKEQEYEKIHQKEEVEIIEIKKQDPIVKIMENAKKQIEEIKNKEERYFPTYDFYTEETAKKIEIIYKQTKEERQEIEKKYKEIESLCEGANWEEKIKVYERYKLI